mmetsp:Transcript_27860/g.63207  ORF Transcript_27860/g.63207 Transcript_27860/m.63207 type:complete len:80 (-) Transcript_27860:1381-1620(-)
MHRQLKCPPIVEKARAGATRWEQLLAEVRSGEISQVTAQCRWGHLYADWSHQRKLLLEFWADPGPTGAPTLLETHLPGT